MNYRIYFDGDYVRVCRDNDEDKHFEVMTPGPDGMPHWEVRPQGSMMPRVDRLAFTYWAMKTKNGENV